MKRILVTETGSTNDDALALVAAERPEEGTILQAFRQTRGRGQSGAPWEAAPGESITASLILYPEFLEPSRGFALAQAMGLAVSDCVQAACGCPAPLKWPNDVLLGGRKVAGILIESRLRAGRFDAAVVGVGLNVNQRSFPPDLPFAGSLRMHAGREFDLEETGASLHERLLERYRELAEDAASVEHDYLERLYGAGRELAFRSAGRAFRGVIGGVDPSGRLLVTETGGELRAYGVKEISFDITGPVT